MKTQEYKIKGFKASAFTAGLKKNKAMDIAMIYSETDTAAAAVFTTNKVKAAPVLLSMENIRDHRIRAVIVNAGNANACTGRQGMENARLTAQMAARELGIGETEIIIASTGVIGAQLNMDLIEKSVPELARNLSAEGIPLAAQAIMTTDSFPKISRFKGMAGSKPYEIIGIAKGAGMIMPNMATMLCFIMTDLWIDSKDLQKALSHSVESSFNRITVDGDTSTNDMVLVMANGMSGNLSLGCDGYDNFLTGLKHVMTELALMIVKDGEGATKVVSIKVKGTTSKKEALTAARTIANSSLVKTAFFGQDPNWGRIMAALGRSGIHMREEMIDIYVDDIKIVENGMGIGSDKEKMAAEKMKNKDFSVTIDLKQGDYEDQVTTCDLTHEYVSINANYRT